MHRSSSIPWLLSVALTLALARPDASLGDPPATVTAEERILDALESRLDFNVVKVPLTSVAKSLSERTGIAIQVDTKTLEDTGVDISIPLSFQGKNFRLRSVLAHLLAPLELVWIIRDDALVLTSRESVNASMEVRIYPVGDVKLPTGEGWLKGPSSQIAQLIESTVEPASWESVGGPATIRPMKDHLVVRQSVEVHREIARSFDTLRSSIAAHDKWDGKSRPLPGLEDGVSLSAGGEEEAELRRALEAPVALMIEDSPLAEAVEFLSGKAGVRFVLDEKGLADAGIELNLKVSSQAKEIPLRSALKMMLRPHNLSFRIWHETIQVTTLEIAAETRTLRLYPVYDLVRDGNSSDLDLGDANETTAPQLIEIITGTITPDTWDTVGGAGMIEYYPQPGVMFVSQTADAHQDLARFLERLRTKMPVRAKVDRQAQEQKYVTRVYRLVQNPPGIPLPEGPSASELADLVRRIVAPESWKEGAGEIHSAKGVLVVRQRAIVHSKVERLLGELGAIAPNFEGGLGGSPVPVVGSNGSGRAAVGGGGFFAVPAGQ